MTRQASCQMGTADPIPIAGLIFVGLLIMGGCEASRVVDENQVPGTLDARRALLFDSSAGDVDLDSSGGNDGGNDGGSATGPPCAPIKHYTFTLKNDIGLYCPPNGPFKNGFRTLFKVNVPAQGYAVARVNLRLRHLGKGAKAHFWNARVSVGKPEFVHGIGDDLCPNEVKSNKMNIGYGSLSASSSEVTVLAKQGCSVCRNGILQLLKGSKLEVWVEDPSPQCKKQQILVQSYYKTVNDYTSKTCFKWAPYKWKKILQQTITLKKQTSTRVISVLEATPHMNPNDTCGKTAAKEKIMTKLGKNTSIKTEPLPATQGMGHLVMQDDLTVTLPAGSHTATLSVNQFYPTPKKVNPGTGLAVTTTGCCCGDAYLVTILGPVTSQ
jgi:hypothetical protein